MEDSKTVTKEIEEIDANIATEAIDYTSEELDQVSVVESESICKAIAAIDDTSETSLALEAGESEADADD